MTKQEVGLLIRKAREAHGLTQEELGEKINKSADAVQKWEVGRHSPQFEDIERLCEILEIPPESLFNKPDAVKNIPEKDWRIPNIPEGLGDVPDITTTEHDLIDRLPDFIKKYVPDHEMLDFMRFEAYCGDAALSEMQRRCGISWERAEKIVNKYTEYMEKYENNHLGREFWRNIARQWNPSNGTPVPDTGYHRFMVDGVLETVMSRISGGEIFALSFSHNLSSLYTLIKRAEATQNLKIGTKSITYEYETNSEECCPYLSIYIDHAGIINICRWYDIDNGPMIMNWFFNIEEVPVTENKDTPSEENADLQDKKKDKKKNIFPATLDVSFFKAIRGIKEKEITWPVYLKAVRGEVERNPIPEDSNFELYSTGITDTAREFISWYEESHPWRKPGYVIREDRWATEVMELG